MVAGIRMLPVVGREVIGLWIYFNGTANRIC